MGKELLGTFEMGSHVVRFFFFFDVDKTLWQVKAFICNVGFKLFEGVV